MMENRHCGKKRGRDTPLNGTIVEGADYLMDMEVNNQRKNRVRVDAEDTRWDETYLSFMVDLENYWEAKFVEEDDEEDPIYAMFLENLKEHGSSYMLDVSMEYGVCSPIMYEIETETLVLPKRRSSRTCQGTNMRKDGRLDVDEQLKSRLKDSSSAEKVKNHPSDTIKKLTPRARQGTYVHKGRNMDVNGELKYGLRTPGIVSEVETDSSIVVKMETSRTRQGNIFRKEESTGSARHLKSTVKDSGYMNEVETDPSHVIERRTPRTCQYRNIQNNGNLPADRMVTSSQKNVTFPEKKKQEADETYNSFLTGLKVIGDSVVYEFGDHEQIFYERCVQNVSADTATNPAKSIPRPPIQPPTSPNKSAAPSLSTPSSTEPINSQTTLSPTANHNILNSSSTDKTLHTHGKDSQKEHAKIWRELHKILGKPFDQNEFDDLWKTMTFRSEVQIYRDSRRGGTYKPGRMGDSYLDKYPELNAEIEKVKSDSSKVLNLLRMLSFYLMKLPHGIPRPWLPDYRKIFLP